MKELPPVSLNELAAELGLDRSFMRKYVLKAGFTPQRVRTPDSRNQLTLALSAEDADAVREKRRLEGFNVSGPVVLVNDDGFLYVVLLVPELSKTRIKIGFSSDMVGRLDAHRTAAPTLALVTSWPCKRVWEATAVASITRSGCTLIANEVYDCEDLGELIQRGESFFNLMPEVMVSYKETAGGELAF